MKEKHITLMNEEIDSLLSFKEICVYESETEKVFLRIPQIKRYVLMNDILERYDNKEYWDVDIINNPDISEVE